MANQQQTRRLYLGPGWRLGAETLVTPAPACDSGSVTGVTLRVRRLYLPAGVTAGATAYKDSDCTPAGTVRLATRRLPLGCGARAGAEVSGDLECASVQGAVLLWLTNSASTISTNDGLQEVREVYESLGVEVHRTGVAVGSGGYTGNIQDYFLIVWPVAISEPPWWATIASGGWSGRIHVTSEHQTGGVPDLATSRTFLNSRTATHGMLVANDYTPASVGGEYSTPEAGQPLTRGCPDLHGYTTASISGGTTLFTCHDFVPDFFDPRNSRPIVQQNKPGGIDWVLAGDVNHLSPRFDTNTGFAWENIQFLWNLVTVPV